MKINWKSVALTSWLLVPMLAVHTINTASERDIANTQLGAMKQMQTSAHHNSRNQLAELEWTGKYAANSVTECEHPRAAVKLALGKDSFTLGSLSINYAARHSGWRSAALNTSTSNEGSQQ